MIVEIKSNISGTEYWDTKAKRILVVPKGEQPNFQVDDNPEEIITPEEPAKIPEEIIEKAEPTSDLEDMTIKGLRDYASKVGVEIPGAIKAKDDIIAFLSDQL